MHWIWTGPRAAYLVGMSKPLSAGIWAVDPEGMAMFFGPGPDWYYRVVACADASLRVVLQEASAGPYATAEAAQAQAMQWVESFEAARWVT